MSRNNIYETSLDFYHGLPDSPSPGFKAANIQGDLPTEVKQLAANATWWYMTGDTLMPTAMTMKGNIFASEVAKQLRIVEMNARPHKDVSMSRARVVFELEIDKKTMCNVYGIMHGGASEFILDICSSAPTLLLGIASGADYMGPGKDVHLEWLKPAHAGKTLIITCEITNIEGRIFTVDGKIIEKDSRKVLVTATQRVVATKIPQSSKL